MARYMVQYMGAHRILDIISDNISIISICCMSNDWKGVGKGCKRRVCTASGCVRVCLPPPMLKKRKKGRCAGCADGGQQESDRARGEAPRLLEAVGISDFCAEIARKAFVVICEWRRKERRLRRTEEKTAPRTVGTRRKPETGTGGVPRRKTPL